jgi:SAM-dependent methyltransferase
MQVHQEAIPEITRYLENKKHLSVEDMRPDYEAYLRTVGRFKKITPETRILEVGTGTGWFPLLAKIDGLNVRGLEISPQLRDFALEWGKKYGVVPDIQLGNLEESDVGDNEFDIVIANSVFEHVEHWEIGVQRVAKALRPGGILYFCSTNKFSPVSYEYPMLFYGWMPNQMRYKFRQSKDGAEIMKLGIDFNQFRYPELRRAFRQAGFRKIMDRIDVVDTSQMSGAKAAAVNLLRSSSLLKWPVLTFCDATVFVCEK